MFCQQKVKTSVRNRQEKDWSFKQCKMFCIKLFKWITVAGCFTPKSEKIKKKKKKKNLNVLIKYIAIANETFSASVVSKRQHNIQSNTKKGKKIFCPKLQTKIRWPVEGSKWWEPFRKCGQNDSIIILGKPTGMQAENKSLYCFLAHSNSVKKTTPCEPGNKS